MNDAARPGWYLQQIFDSIFSDPASCSADPIAFPKKVARSVMEAKAGHSCLGWAKQRTGILFLCAQASQELFYLSIESPFQGS
jgi:hypothetical protein